MSKASLNLRLPGLLVSLLFLALCGLAGPSFGQDLGEPLKIKVGYRVLPPFITKQSDGTITGMASELWREIEDGFNIEPTYVEYQTVADLLTATAARDVDVAVGAISITEERAELVDFTQPWFDSGLRVMVDDRTGSSLVNVWNGLAEAGYLRYYAWLLVLIMLGTIGLTLFDRHFDKNFPKRWREGVSESFYAVMLVVTKGSLPSRAKLFGWYGRIFSAFWLIIGIAVVAYITSSVTSVMTSIAITGSITGPDDLPGRTVGVFKGSTAENRMRRNGVDFITYTGMDDAVAALRGAEIDAIVGDAPVLEYYKAQNPALGLDVVGRIFAPDKFGFALPYGQDTLIQPITLRLLSLQEDGVVRELAQQYFGNER
ncbi:transporter substrate-binding domain-containing protein [Martelella soudanensis]|uniref:transporter substrate-binding domain-containing protein n=1 Tax=unclassified Martelella TaxID=2629616 RepID=UPI0015DDF7F1|nr:MULTISPECIES: transporter substrate-binding domain-containing protein [unclassified Martelella]